MNFEEYFEQNEELLYKVRGISMLPMLDQNRDVVLIRRKGKERLKEDDVALFRRNSNYVLHRVIEVGSGKYTFLGDNCINCETGVKEADVLGVLTGFEHHGTFYSVDDSKYQLYVRWIRRTRKLRIALKKMKIFLKKCVRHCIPGKGDK